jgi:phage baseplate assembly protein W
MAEEKFIGLQYPIVNSAKGLMSHSSNVDQIKADMLQLLLTNPGERVMLPTFGVNLRKLIFEPNDTTLEMAAKSMIAEALQQWEPRVVISQIEVTSKFSKSDLNTMDNGDELEAILGIKINFIDPQNIQVVEELTLEIPVSGG